MLAVICYHPGDQDSAERLAVWMEELGGCNGHTLLLVNDSRINPQDADRIYSIFARSFGSVRRLSFVDHHKKWPHSPNALFSFVARQLTEPFLWLEPDCGPRWHGWMDVIVEEYQVALTKKKLFMGDSVKGVGGSPDHMSGIGVYPGNIIRHAGNTVIAGDRPWDLAGASQIVPQAYFTPLIKHTWRRQSFVTQEEVNAAMPPEAVLFHASKDGSLIRLMRERLFPASTLLEKAWNNGPRDEYIALSETPSHTIQTDHLVRELDGSVTHYQTKEGETPSVTRHGMQGEPATGSDEPHATAVTEPMTFMGKEYMAMCHPLRDSNEPLFNGDSREALVRDTVSILKRLCGAPRHTSQVRKELKAQGVTR